MEPAHLAPVVAPLAVELGDRLGEDADRPAEPAQGRLVVGQDVRTPQLVQLDPVLEGAEERVGLVELLAVLAADVATLAEAGQRAQRRALAQRRVGPAVHELQELHGELDVAQPARAELDLPLGLVGRDVVDDPTAHRLHVGDEAVATGGAPHHRRDHLDVAPAQLEVAGHRPRLEQRLELPGLGPLLVVAPVAGERPHERALAALGPQVGVDRPDRALAGVVGADAHQVRGQLGGRPQGDAVVRTAGPDSTGSWTKTTSTSEM